MGGRDLQFAEQEKAEQVEFPRCSSWKKGPGMYIIQIYMECVEKFSEILPNDLEYAELVVEDLVSHILLDFFTEAIIDEVSISFSSDSLKEQQPSFIRINAQCSNRISQLLSNDVENMELALEASLSCVLVELLGSVNVNKVEIKLLSPTMPK
jgi:hypothetical protein